MHKIISPGPEGHRCNNTTRAVCLSVYLSIYLYIIERRLTNCSHGKLRNKEGRGIKINFGPVCCDLFCKTVLRSWHGLFL
jgi:hypothetical protein